MMSTKTGRTWMLGFLSALAAAGIVARPNTGSADAVDVAPVVTSFGPRPSHNGLFRGAVVSYPPRLDGSNWIVRLETQSGQNVASAQVSARASMPETGATLAGALRVREYVGDGQYRIGGLRFTHAGWWNVALVITHRGQTDSLAFNLIVPSSHVAKSFTSR